MKKVLSVAMASAMVLGMGANAFAIKYNVDSNDTAKWPKNFGFEGSLFVTDKNGDRVKNATTNINKKTGVDFQPGDVVWMPLYADNQKVYTNHVEEGKPGKEELNNVEISVSNVTAPVNQTGKAKWMSNGWHGVDGQAASKIWEKGAVAYGDDGSIIAYDNVNGADNLWKEGVTYTFVKAGTPASVTTASFPTTVNVHTVDSKGNVKWETRPIDVVTVDVNGTTFTGKVAEVVKQINEHLKTLKDENGYVNPTITAVAHVAEVEGTDTIVKDPTLGQNGVVTVAHGPYTGNIDKNWSINLLEEKGSTMTDFVEKAELYKADEIDAASYGIPVNSVFVKVQLKKEWKNCDTKNVKYYVYVADNAGKQTNKVYVEGKYGAPEAQKVDFTWSNDASKASLWKAEENGVAVFDFQDKAFFTVKMYKGECLYLDLDAAYKLATAKEFDGDIDSFYYFDKENANFFREGELVIVSDNDELNVYEVTEDGAEQVEADYVKGHAVAHTNQKVNGYVFNTKELGNYILAEGVEEDEIVDEEEDDEVEAPEVEDNEETPAKPNPDTGANDFVGLAVSLAVVSVAAAGALALKK